MYPTLKDEIKKQSIRKKKLESTHQSRGTGHESEITL
jgi:hypothetical protein